MECELGNLPLIVASHGGEAPEIEPLLRQHLRNSPCPIHPCERVEYALPSVGKGPFRFFPIDAAPDGLGGPDSDDQACLTDLERTRNDFLQNLDQLLFRHLGVHVQPEAAVDVALCRHHLPQARFELLLHLGLVGER